MMHLHTLIALAGIALPEQARPAGERPNVLWLIAEDLSLELGCYGDGLVQTPHLDRLAAEGVRFTSAFATASVCSPSRSAFLTGMYQTSIDSHQHRNLNPQPLPEGVRLIPEYFRDAGYFIFNGDADHLSKAGKMDVNFLCEEEAARYGTDWRQAPAGQPFFGMIQFEETHRDFEGDPLAPVSVNDVVLPPYYPDHPLARRDWADYLEDVQILDRKVGAILKRLDGDGVRNTILVFMGDHGRPMPRDKQFIYDGGIQVPLIIQWSGHLPAGRVEESLVSLIDVGPSCMALAGIDIPESMQGRPFFGPQAQEREYIFAARDRCGEAADRIRCVRSKKYKYIRNFYPNRPYAQFSGYKEIQYPMLHLMRYLHQQNRLSPEQQAFLKPTRPYEELYDVEADPFELHNLAGQAEHAATLETLRDVLDRWMVDTRDAGEIPEEYAEEVRWYLRNQQWYDREMKTRGLAEDDRPETQVEYWIKRLRAGTE